MLTEAERQAERDAEAFANRLGTKIVRRHLPLGHRLPFTTVMADTMAWTHGYKKGRAQGSVLRDYTPTGMRVQLELTGDGQRWTNGTCTVTFDDGTSSMRFKGTLNGDDLVITPVPKEISSSAPGR